MEEEGDEGALLSGAAPTAGQEKRRGEASTESQRSLRAAPVGRVRTRSESGTLTLANERNATQRNDTKTSPNGNLTLELQASDSSVK